MNTDTRPNGDEAARYEAECPELPGVNSSPILQAANDYALAAAACDRERFNTPRYYDAMRRADKAWLDLAALAASRTSGEAGGSEAPRTLPETMSRDEMLRYYSEYANLCAHEALRYQKRIRDLEAALASQPQGVSGDALGYIDSLLIGMKGRASSADPFVVSKRHLRELRRLIEVERASAPQGVSLSDGQAAKFMALVDAHGSARWSTGWSEASRDKVEAKKFDREAGDARRAIESELRSLAAPGQEGRAVEGVDLLNKLTSQLAGLFAARPDMQAAAMADLNAMFAAPTQEVKDGKQAGVPGWFITRRNVWRRAIETLAKQDDSGFWPAELKTFDEAFERLWSVMGSTPSSPEVKDAVWRDRCESLLELWDDKQSPGPSCYKNSSLPNLFEKVRAELAAEASPDVKDALPLWWDDFLREVAELPDRNSPEDEPEAMVATADELSDCARAAIASKKGGEA